MAAIPLRYEAVTADWLTEVLQPRWPGIEITSLRRGPIFGHKQNKFRVETTCSGNDNCSFIVKGNFPGENDPATGSAWAMANELHSLRDLVPLISAPVGPDWYHIDISAAASIIVMQDLAPEGAIFFDAFRTLEAGHAFAFMDAFARMHASRWNSPEFQPGGLLGPDSFAGENRRLVNQGYFPTFFTEENWQSYVALPRGRALPRAFQELGRAETAWKRMWSVLQQAAMTVIHGDEHLGNLYVTADGTPGVIDWVARPEHWPIGISYFLLCSLDIADRRQWERPLLAHYLSRLSAYGAADVPAFEEAWFLYRCASFYPVVTWLNNSAVWQPEAVNTANAVRAATAALDHGVFELLDA